MAGMYEHTIDSISSGHKIYVFRLGILLSAYFCMHVFTYHVMMVNLPLYAGCDMFIFTTCNQLPYYVGR